MIEMLLKNSIPFEHFIKHRKLAFFSDTAIDFVASFSEILQKKPQFKQNPELLALAFWMRRSSIKRLMRKYTANDTDAVSVAVGTVFHIAPTNVDSIFLYSWLLSLLAGNKNIIRVSKRTYNRNKDLFHVIDELLSQDKFHAISSRLFLMTYDHDDKQTEMFSSVCDLRIIWGGDETVEKINRVKLPVGTNQIAFPNKFSMAVFNARAVLNENIENLVGGFYSDTYWFDQMACSSPRLVNWVGGDEEIFRAQRKFWGEFEAYVIEKLGKQNNYSGVARKQLAEQLISIRSTVRVQVTSSQYVNRIALLDADYIPEEHHCGHGLFFEKSNRTLIDVLLSVQKHYQTAVFFGITPKEIKQSIIQVQPEARMRFVLPGHALNFSEVWDGISLISNFSYQIRVEADSGNHTLSDGSQQKEVLYYG
ncbi:MAG: acyl-CoA reductase [Coxiellaceae bacterium]|nr:acyl-CoA reductase [Coxiellaceae bacterium]